VINSRSGSSSRPADYRFRREVIAVPVRWYLRYGLSCRDVEELLAERGIEVDHVPVYRWVQTFALEFIDATRLAVPTGAVPPSSTDATEPSSGLGRNRCEDQFAVGLVPEPRRGAELSESKVELIQAAAAPACLSNSRHICS